MAFPDDYRRVQQAGGTQAQVESTTGLPRQVLVDMDNLSPRLMDGVVLGGHKFMMQREFAGMVQSSSPEGEVDYVKDQVTNDPTNPKRTWRSSKLRLLFQMIADMTDVNNWLIKDSAMPAGFRASAILINNLDTALVDGFYRFVPAGALNAPVGLVGADQYMLMTIRQSSSELTQVIFSRAADGKIWTRSRVGGVFQAWTLATGVTAADLLLKVNKAGDTMTGKLILPVPTNVLAQLNMRSGVSPAAPNDGDVWRDDGNGGIRFRKGGSTVKIIDSQQIVKIASAVISDTKVSGSSAQAIPNGVWTTRHLNTENSDTNGIVTLSGNAFTLLAGSDYTVIAIVSVGANSSATYAAMRIYNVTDGVAVQNSIIYNNINAGAIYTHTVTPAILSGGKTYRIEQLSTGPASAGNPVSIPGTPEVYLMIRIERLSNGFA